MVGTQTPDSSTMCPSATQPRGLIDKNDAFYILNHPNILIEFIGSLAADKSVIIKHLLGIANNLAAQGFITDGIATQFKEVTSNRFNATLA